jgi:phosphoribosyl 1,2-cyclic phosphodiesterase
MKLKVLGSSSSGNCYLMEGADGTLIIEAGVHIKKIKEGLGFNLSKVVGCIITHSHQDHCRSATNLMTAGVDVYMSALEAQRLGIDTYHRLNRLKGGNVAKIGNFEVLPFSIQHDTPDPLGFLIKHPECGTVLFLTDSFYSKYTFKGLNNIIVECNFEEEIIDNNNTPNFLRNRIYGSHMHLKTCKELLLRNDLSAVNNIVLIHLSNTNADEVRFQKEISELTGKTVTAARSGTVIEFNKQPF